MRHAVRGRTRRRPSRQYYCTPCLSVFVPLHRYHAVLAKHYLPLWDPPSIDEAALSPGGDPPDDGDARRRVISHANLFADALGVRHAVSYAAGHGQNQNILRMEAYLVGPPPVLKVGFSAARCLRSNQLKGLCAHCHRLSQTFTTFELKKGIGCRTSMTGAY